ncbi:hypothetical protein BAUCODRAFT_474318 [Baudoinia panamericana UAMH 10762]|uniref:RING-type E3 ubiquitin transferase n=1 Tax=Baudoinia panamericana (strain UAMH 10762) TaxID=717646 RepID=M2MXX2_BAUPA|nr:uncharacterized protein BAUCODRAFT_474318 [Baudoinia panamericana UAMH 10762]EMC96423.1 hypothetical protein BAUCODRAFT_474318 [Baudoinia panamericana UAMH 10762]
MERPSPPPPQARDMVYCHQCENEWYRDEHGLTCPECQSDFTEIIEPNHDPRDDNLLPEQDVPQGGFYGAPDPDEDDIDNIQWQQTGPDTYRARINRTIDIQPGQQQQQGGGLLGGILGGLGTLIGGALGGGEQQQGQQSAEQRPQSPDAGQNRSSSAPGGPRNGTTVRTFHGPNYHMSIMTSSSSNLYPRNANGPQPFQPQPDHIEQMMAQMLMNIGVPPNGQHPRGGMGMGGMHMGGPGMMFVGPDAGFPGGPQQHPFGPAGLGNLFQMLGMPPMMGGPGGQFGDAVFSQEALDRIVTQLMEQHQSGNAPGPASEAAIKSLPKRDIVEKDLGESGKAECTICMDEVNIGETVTVLPCSHWFHGDCIKAWLSEHDTCPHCRQGIMPKDEPNTNRPRQPSQAPLNDTNSPEYQSPRDVPGGFPSMARQESGSRDHPFTVPESPQLHRRSSSTPGARPSGSRQASSTSTNYNSGNNNGMFQRMRDAFSSRDGSGQGSGSGGGPS